MSFKGKMFRLVNFESSFGEAPKDMIAVIRTVTLDASGDGTVDLSGLAAYGAPVSFSYMAPTNLSDAGILTIEKAEIGKVSEDATVLILFNARDIAQSGE